MTNTPVDQAKEIAAEVFEVSAAEIKDDDTIETLNNWDSLNHMRMLMLLEDRFNTTIDTEVAMEMFSILAIANWIETQKSS